MFTVVRTTRSGLAFSLAMVIGITLFILACGGEATAVAEPAAATAAPAPAATVAPAPVATAAPAPVATAAPAATAAPRAQASAATPVPQATAAPTRAPGPAIAAKFNVQKLKFAMPAPVVESNRTWVSGWNYISQHDVFAETLLRADALTGEAGPLLAESWEATNDFKTWSFKLRENIPFQFGWGNFTTPDVVHTFDQLIREDSLASLKDPAWDQATPEIIDDYNIKFHFENPYLDGTRLFSRHAGDLIVMSKAQFDELGLGAFDQIHTAGTGPYQLTARDLGATLSYERVPEGHWKYDVDFEEFEFVWAPESLTRMALLLAEEVHISQIERTLQPDAEARGMRVISSTQESVQTYTRMGGLYFRNTEKWPDHYTPGLPFENENIRKALNIAIDRDVINEEIYLGRATPNYKHAYHPNNEGWNPEWVERWDEMYGYDPEEARRILAAEGYGPDNPLLFKFISTVIPGSPELVDVVEATQIMFADVGVEVEIEKMDVAQYVARFREHRMHNTFRASRNLPIRTTQEGLRIFYTSYGTSWGFAHPYSDEKYECLVRSADLAEREVCAREAGDFLYDTYADIPMFHLHGDVTVNPKFVSDYIWPGLTSAGVSHFHEIKGVRE